MSRAQAAHRGWACLRDLGQLISSDPIPTRASLAQTVETILSIARRAAPETVEELRLPLDAYLYHLDLT